MGQVKEGDGNTVFRLLVDNVREYAIFLLDPGGYVRSWNAGAERIKGYRAEEILGQHFGRFYPEGTPRQRLDDELDWAVEHGHFEEESWRVRKDGTQFWASIVITALFDSRRELVGFAKVTRDLTDRRRHEQERADLVAREARALAEAEARDQFLVVAAHELKTPMTTAKAAAQLLSRAFSDRSTLDPTQARSIEIVDEQIGRLSQLVGRLLDVMQVQGGKLVIYREPTDLAALVRAAADRFVPFARQKIVASTPATLVCDLDPLRFDQVLTNLIGNALKFSPSDEPITVTLEKEHSVARLVVRDRGPGVPEAERHRMFERFFQVNPDRSGMGLGLFISKEIVEAHGGAISATFPRDGGAVFSVVVPL